MVLSVLCIKGKLSGFPLLITLADLINQAESRRDNKGEDFTGQNLFITVTGVVNNS